MWCGIVSFVLPLLAGKCIFFAHMRYVACTPCGSGGKWHIWCYSPQLALTHRNHPHSAVCASINRPQRWRAFDACSIVGASCSYAFIMASKRCNDGLKSSRLPSVGKW